MKGNEITAIITPIAEIYYSQDTKWGTYVVTSTTEIPHFKEDDFNAEKQWKGKMTGNMQLLDLGTQYSVVGEMVEHSKYGWSISPQTVLPDIKMSDSTKRKFLGSLVTENQLSALLGAYPDIVEIIMEHSKKGIKNVSEMGIDFSKLKGLTEKNFTPIKEKIISNFVIADVLAFLSPLGISYKAIQKITDGEPNPFLLKEKLYENPYILMRINGLGFKKVDNIALKLKPELIKSEFRAITCIRHILQEAGETHGHLWVVKDKIYKNFVDNVPECQQIFEKVIEEQRLHSTFLHVDGNNIGLKSRRSIEFDIALNIETICKTPSNKTVTENHIRRGIEKSNKIQGFKFDEYQTEIIEKAVNNKFVVVTGNSGVGKSSISRGILNVFKEAGMHITCCALSAKATKVIEKSTGFEASTIHRAFGISPQKPKEEEIFLFTDVLLVDEISMVNSSLVGYMLSHIKSSAIVVFVGDDKQLPPIGYGNVLRDLLENQKYLNSSISGAYVNQLKKIYRQADNSGIVHDANIIRDNKYPFENIKDKMVTGILKDMFYLFLSNSDSIYKEALNKYLGLAKTKPLDDIVLICPVKTRGIVCAENFNKDIQEKLVGHNPYLAIGKTKYHIGAKVMQTKNDYDKMVFNGDEGYITLVDKDSCNIKFIGKKMEHKYTRAEMVAIELSYCVSFHKCQGSQFNTVICAIDTNAFILLDSCLLYTGITRAEKRCMVISNLSAFNTCITTNKQIKRHTYLSDMLKEIK